MSWEPNRQSVEQLRVVLSATLSPNHTEREQATAFLEQAKSLPDFLNYLLYILAFDSDSTAQIKASAGLILKNSINKFNKLDQNSYLLTNIFKGLFNEIALVRNITGNVITTLFERLGTKNWPSLIPQLFELIENQSISTAQEGSISTINKICEDSSHILNKEINGSKPLAFMIPKLLQLLNSSDPIIIANSLGSINHLIHLDPQGQLIPFEALLERLFQLAVDQNKDVRRNVCTSFSQILEIRPQNIIPHLEGVINYSVHTINEAEEEVALEACEFLLSLATSGDLASVINKFLPNILPVLLKQMVYSEMDIAMMDNDDDADEEDKEEDIKPKAAKINKANSSNDNGHSAGHNNNDDDSDSDEDDDEDGDFSTEWNIRKCSAATLDVLASVAPEQVLAIILPILKVNIVSEQWPIREAAILAFGAVAEGGIELASKQLPELVPFLVDRLQDKEAPVRQITCWTLGRYSPWICSEAHSGGAYSNYFIPTFQSIMKCSLDRKKIVQEGACSSLAQFIENSDSDLIQPLSKDILITFNACFNYYKKKNLVILYDSIQTFVEKSQLDDESISTILPPLIHKWEILADDDRELWPLLECMSSIAALLGERFAPFAVQVYERSIRILSHCIEMDRLSVTDPTIHTPEKDFVISSLDLVDGLIQGLGEHSGELINDNLMTLLIETFADENNDVRQSAYALLGDLAMYIPEKISNHLQAVIGSIGFEIIASSNSNEAFAVVNNATWALGEIALRLDIKDYLEKLINILIDLINSPAMDTVLENAAITIGRIGISYPEYLSAHLSEFALNWSRSMLYLELNDEKESAFKGMCQIILTNPTGLNNESLIAFVNTIPVYTPPNQELIQLFRKLLLGYKELLGQDWIPFLQSLSDGELIDQTYCK